MCMHPMKLRIHVIFYLLGIVCTQEFNHVYRASSSQVEQTNFKHKNDSDVNLRDHKRFSLHTLKGSNQRQMNAINIHVNSVSLLRKRRQITWDEYCTNVDKPIEMYGVERSYIARHLVPSKKGSNVSIRYEVRQGPNDSISSTGNLDINNTRLSFLTFEISIEKHFNSERYPCKKLWELNIKLNPDKLLLSTPVESRPGESGNLSVRFSASQGSEWRTGSQEHCRTLMKVGGNH